MTERAVIFLLAAVSGFGVWTGLSLALWDMGSPGSGLMPTIGAGIMAVALPFVLWELRGGGGNAAAPVESAPALALAVLIAIVPAIAVAGMSAALAMAGVAILRGVEKWPLWRAAAFSFAVVAGIWGLFGRLLGVPLPPPGSWWW